MARETKPQKKARLHQVIAALEATYPDAHCELNYTNPLELLIATILSAQCTDKMVNRVTETLFQKYKSAADYANAEVEDLAAAIQRLGFFRNKAKSIQSCCRAIIEHHQGAVPHTMEALTALNGVGRKTANVVLGNAFNINHGIVVDTHVARLSARLGLVTDQQPEKIERTLMDLVPQEQWAMLSHWLIWHGRRRCMARNPNCAGCEIKDLCPKRGVKL